MLLFGKEYKTFIFDFDGVILDSNFIKEKCISEVSKNNLNEINHREFVEYFINNNGIPRELKISKFFGLQECEIILNKYNSCLKQNLKGAKLTEGLLGFLDLLAFYNKNMFVVSGGDENEVKELSILNNIDHFFSGIKGGPKLKEENISSLNITGETLFIGDSKKDFEVADKFNFDFVFMYGYTHFDNWRSYFYDKKILRSIKDFGALINCMC